MIYSNGPFQVGAAGEVNNKVRNAYAVGGPNLRDTDWTDHRFVQLRLAHLGRRVWPANRSGVRADALRGAVGRNRGLEL